MFAHLWCIMQYLTKILYTHVRGGKAWCVFRQSVHRSVWLAWGDIPIAVRDLTADVAHTIRGQLSVP